jgi:hypothetical protein
MPPTMLKNVITIFGFDDIEGAADDYYNQSYSSCVAI